MISLIRLIDLRFRRGIVKLGLLSFGVGWGWVVQQGMKLWFLVSITLCGIATSKVCVSVS